jgi:hypothetical protein
MPRQCWTLCCSVIMHDQQHTTAPLHGELGFRSRSLETLLPAPRAVGLHQPPEYLSGPVALPWVAGSRSGPSRPLAAQPAPQRKVV